MSISSWLWGASQTDEAFDKATSELLPSGSEDIALNLEIADQIRSKAIPSKDATRALKRRLNHKNPNVQLLALGLTDTCVKNGGDHFLVEIASRDFVDNLISILKMPTLNPQVKAAILRYIQNWASAFEGKVSLSYVNSQYETLKREGFRFPPKDHIASSSAMVDTRTAPEWIDSDVCLRCRTAFTFTNRKHHCRNCGQVFDHACSSKLHSLPHYGIAQEVRVCDGCHSILSKTALELPQSKDEPRTQHSSSRPAARPGTNPDADLQRAIQLSLDEANNSSAQANYVPSRQPWSEPPIVDKSNGFSNIKEDEDDPELRAAIEASLREASAPKASAPLAPASLEVNDLHSSGLGAPQHRSSHVPPLPKYDLDPLESDAIMSFSQAVEQAGVHGARDITRYPEMNALYDKANGLRPKLAMNLDDTGRKEQVLTDMHDKLSQAVKLYDKLLTDQLAHRSRSPVAHPPSPSWANRPQTYGLQSAVESVSTAAPPIFAPQRGYSEYAPPSAPPMRHETIHPQSQGGFAASQWDYEQRTSVQPSTSNPIQSPPIVGPPADLSNSAQFASPMQRSPARQPGPPSVDLLQNQHAILPSFPVAPTSAPQHVSFYGAGLSAPSASPNQQSERESMLIDL